MKNEVKYLKHPKPSPVIKKLLPRLYSKGFYLVYGQLRILELWLSFKKGLCEEFYDKICKEGVYKSPQSARNQVVHLRRMGITVENGKLRIC